MFDIEPVIQQKPIITSEELAILQQRKFVVTKGKSPHTKKVEVDLYTANDEEFMKYLLKEAKAKRKEIEKRIDETWAWTNQNRLRTRIALVNDYLS